MRTLPDGLAAHLAAGVTTLARCWRIMRGDGLTLGFTDHDVALVFDGVSHEPAAGFTASEVPSSLGLAVDTSEVLGALVSLSLTEDDLIAGLYDGARVEVHLVNWSALDERLLLEAGLIGEVTRTGPAFKAEIRSVASLLEQERGRVYAAKCDATLGDARCQVPLNVPGRQSPGTVQRALGPRTLLATGLDAIPSSGLRGGVLQWQGGANKGRRSEIRDDAYDLGARVLDLWEPPPEPINADDQFNATVGCDKSFATCAGVFQNWENFRGFPYIPGNDFAITYAVEGENHNGGKLV